MKGGIIHCSGVVRGARKWHTILLSDESLLPQETYTYVYTCSIRYVLAQSTCFYGIHKARGDLIQPISVLQTHI